MQIHEILRLLMDADMVVGDNVTELTRRTGLPQPTLRNILIGTTTKPRTATLKILADYYGISIAQLNGHVPIDYEKVKLHLLPELPRPSNDIDTELLADIIEAVESWLESKRLILVADKKAKVIQLLYCEYINQPCRSVDKTHVKNLISLAT
jgi:transcriptional regulator with XRE-family HTH domain